MADVRPLHAIHYNIDKVGKIADVSSPPYDVISPQLRERLVSQSPYNVVKVDLPQGDDPYANAGKTIQKWLNEGVLVRDEKPAIWLLIQTYTAPDGNSYKRHGIFARVGLSEYGPGKIRPHERTHAGPKEDRLKLTRATKMNLSPVFSLYSDPKNEIWECISSTSASKPWAEVCDSDGTVHSLWRMDDPELIDCVSTQFEDRELLIADGHHRYETSLAYANEVGGEGPHNFTLMCLVAMEDPGLTVFPTHRLLTNLGRDAQQTLEEVIALSFDEHEVELDQMADSIEHDNGLSVGFIDSRHKQPKVLKLKNRQFAANALSNFSTFYQSLDTAVIEALVFQPAFAKSQEQLVHDNSIEYIKDITEAVERVKTSDSEAAFLMGPPPVSLIREIANCGETMPPKSTYFYPKLLTGMLFSPLNQ